MRSCGGSVYDEKNVFAIFSPVCMRGGAFFGACENNEGWSVNRGTIRVGEFHQGHRSR